MIIDNNAYDIAVLTFWKNLTSWKAFIFTVLVSIGLCLVSHEFIPKDNTFIVTSFVYMAFFSSFIFLSYLASVPIALLVIFYNIVKKGTLGKKELTVNNSGILEDDFVKKTHVPWEKIKGIHLTKKHIFIQFSSLRYFLVPKRNFPNEYSFAVFYSELVKLRQENS